MTNLAAEANKAKTSAPRKCGQCQTEFTPSRVGGRHKGMFCSRLCSVESRKKPVAVLACQQCAGPFQASRNRKVFCGLVCAKKANAGESNPAWKGGKEQRTCAICGKAFEAFPSTPKKTCSPACAASLPRGLSGADNGNFRGGADIGCAACGKATWSTPAQKKVYCSKECFYKGDFESRDSKRWGKGSRWGVTGTKSGRREDIGIYVRSAWEANYARYLNWLIEKKQIVSWEYEKQTFEFAGIKRGTRFYTPDFKVLNNDQSVEFHEVKGWMHPKGKTALDRMTRYHPKVKIVLIGQKEYRAIAKTMKAFIPQWE